MCNKLKENKTSVSGYSKRRVELCIDDCLYRAAKEIGVSISVVKFAHNENSDAYELHYDVHFEDSSCVEDFMNIFNECNPIKGTGSRICLEKCDGTLLSLFYYWYPDKVDECLEFEDSFVENYISVYPFDITGSKDEDLAVLSSNWCWGEVDNFMV